MPSTLALKLACPQTTDYEEGYNGREEKSRPYTGEKKILVVGTEERFLEMKNDTHFDTGNHPVETLVPMLYFRDAGFGFDFATPTGKPIHFEMWAFPNEDEHVKAMYDEQKPRMDAPLSLRDIDAGLDAYAAIFVPGGHGAMHLATNADLGRLLRSAHEKQLTTISLCHGPAALLSAAVGADGSSAFPYTGYKLCVFPDSMDEFSPKIGYMPGKMKSPVGEALLGKGLEIMNTDDDDSVHVHNELITGASPKASSNIGKIAADHLVEKFA